MPLLSDAFSRSRALLAIFFSLLMGLSSASHASSCSTDPLVKIADLSWESAQFSTALYERILRQGYGCQVERVPGTSAALENALAQNDLHIIPEIWSGRTEIIEKALAAGQIQVLGETLQGGAEQGWYVPEYVIKGDPERGISAQAPGLKSITELAHFKEVFAEPDHPGKGRFYNCPTGWVCEVFNSQLFELNKLGEAYDNFRPGTGAALDSAIRSAYDRGQPILFYYWQPAALMAKYRFVRLQAGKFDQTCWSRLLDKSQAPCASDFILAKLAVAVSTPFFQAHPDLVDFFNKVQLAPEQMNEFILAMNEQGKSVDELVEQFLLDRPEQWEQWVSVQAGLAMRAQLEQGQTAQPKGIFPNWSFAEWTNLQLMKVVQRYGDHLRRFSASMLNGVILPVEKGLQATPAWVLLIMAAAIAWHASRRWVFALLCPAALYLIGAMGLWDKLIQTFSLVVVASLFSIALGIPLGILSARSRLVRALINPVLDLMQTMPGFVYLIPVLMLFGLGKVPAVMATVVYAVPPLIRLTSLGLRQVDPNVLEAAQSYGVTPIQMLYKVTLPLARPSIMAGINQSTMMALSMVVVASMIGAQGLGEDVLAGIQTLDIGRGLQAGLAIVILAIVRDRISQFYGRSERRRQRRR